MNPKDNSSPENCPSSNVLHSRALVPWMCSTSVLPSDGNYILKIFGTKRLYKQIEQRQVYELIEQK